MQSIHSMFVPDSQGKTFTVKHTQDCAPIIKSIEQLKEQQATRGDSEFGRHVARIPLVFLKKWGQEDGIDYFKHLDHAKTMKLFSHLNDPEFRKLRVWEGRLGKEDV